ncbi:type II and III secretion system protein family protein [Salinarimonas ramus]|uniref:Secretin n=1 Tax=Salinarimonas ramus TaxID=690164 RepID=A0A917V333_9HYPH|nr:type II and III secretion system protein family protein [Salinarimonas ramus]GGK32841.1 secretin [Salinarimonas ramus]
MTRAPTFPATLRPRTGLVSALALAAALMAGAPATEAADWRGGGGAVVASQPATAPIVRIAPGEGALSRRVAVAVGKSVIVELPADAREVFVANPAVANAVVRSARKIFLIGQEPGATSVFAFDAEGRQIASLDVDVGRDLDALRQTLRNSIPNARIDVQAAGDSILLTGEVDSALEAQRAVDIANAFVGASGDATGAVVNSLTLGGEDQVMLRVTVVEVERAVLKRFGIDTTAGWAPTPAAITEGLSLASSGAGGTVTAGLSGGGFTVQATLQAFESAGLLRVLAEPTLVAISGESAEFNAGGEIAVRVCNDDAGELRCGTELLDYGVNLAFTPVVLSSGRISLRVATRVRELDPSVEVETGSGARFGFKTRESATSLEMASGSTIMTAGLISSRADRRVAGMPGLLNLPILGTLFRSQAYERRDTELMILVTPFIAQAMEPTEVARPDDGFVDAFDPQAVLLGRLNRIYGTAEPVDPIGLRGTFGFIAD